jgi:NAD(P)-dependent dehydrogenase (short-subunit alcohol dehydrogenase family)
MDGKVAIVTGGAMGLGKGIATGFASLGARVVIVDANEKAGQETADGIVQAGGKASFYSLDVTKSEQFEQMVKDTTRELKRIDVLVNNAGVATKVDCVDMEVEDYRRIIDINLTGVWIGGRAVAPVMMEQKYGKIINMCSMFGFVSLAGLSAYASSKGGVRQLTKTLALELVGYNINVNAVAPAYIATELTNNARTDKERFEDILRRTPKNRLGKLEEVVGPVVFLASELSSFMVGETILVDGGWTAW